MFSTKWKQIFKDHFLIVWEPFLNRWHHPTYPKKLTSSFYGGPRFTDKAERIKTVRDERRSQRKSLNALISRLIRGNAHTAVITCEQDYGGSTHSRDFCLRLTSRPVPRPTDMRLLIVAIEVLFCGDRIKRTAILTQTGAWNQMLTEAVSQATRMQAAHSASIFYVMFHNTTHGFS